MNSSVFFENMKMVRQKANNQRKNMAQHPRENGVLSQNFDSDETRQQEMDNNATRKQKHNLSQELSQYCTVPAYNFENSKCILFIRLMNFSSLSRGPSATP